MRMSERRKAPRLKALKGAHILMLDQFGRTVECVVRNISAGGALLALRTLRGVPDKFQLMFDADRVVRQCRVVWRDHTKLGVAFVAQPGSIRA
jgi:PilZ domain